MQTPSITPAARSATVLCIHCRTPFSASDREAEFCCSGCRFVYHLLHKRGLEDFYHYGEKSSPVGTSVFHERPLDWLRPLQAAAETATNNEVAGLELRVQGISCAGCVWLLEAVFAEHPGAVSCRVNSATGSLRLRWIKGTCDLECYVRDAQRFGYLLGPPGESAGKQPMRPLVRKLGLCGALALNAMLFALPRYLGLEAGAQFAALFDAIALLIASASIAIGGPYFFHRAWAALRRGDLHIDLPISLGLLFAYGGSVLAWITGSLSFAYFDFVAVFTFLMLLGRWLQERSVESNRRRLLGLRLTPGRVLTLRNGLEVDLPAESLVRGDRFSIESNALVPVRSRLIASPATFALNWITGEPAARTFAAGGLVPAGARTLSSQRIELLAMEDWSSSQLARLLAFEDIKPWRNPGLQKLIRIYLSCILIIAAVGFLTWVISGAGILTSFQVLVSILVVSCPCAIGVALPLLDDVAAARLQQFGVHVREASLWARLRQVRTILFDKTGTITLESLTLANPETLSPLAPQTVSTILTLVQNGLHPVAACLRETLLAKGYEASAIDAHVREVPGMGLEWIADGGCWRLGRAAWATEESGFEGTVLSLDRKPLAAFAFREEIRQGAGDQIKRLVQAGYEIFLVSGDEPGRVRTMAAKLGLPESRGLGGLTPDDKASLVSSRWADSALIFGDGANDSLAFDAALCRGTPSVDTGLLENKADFYLLGRSLAGIGELFSLGRRHRLATRMVFSFAITYNALAVSAALLGWMNPLVAAVIMPLSSLASIALVFLALRPAVATATLQDSTNLKPI